MSIPKEERRRLKTYQLEEKENYIYYLYQLICRCYKLLKKQDKYLSDLSDYITASQTQDILKKPCYVDIPYDVYGDFLSLQASVETHLLNTIGDMQNSSLSYYKFRNLIRKKENKKTLNFSMPELPENIWTILKRFNEARNFQNHQPESLITAEAKLVVDKKLQQVQYNPIQIINYEHCTLELLIDLYSTYKHLNEGAQEVFIQMKLDYEYLIGEKLIIQDVFSKNSKGTDHLEAVKIAYEIQK